jgi:hypothetical protein
MALNTQLSDLVVNTQADALNALFNGGKIKIYDGTQPATADTAVTTQTLGVTLTLNATAFAAASGGVLTANAITSGVAIADITPTWARITKADGSTVLMDVSVGVSGCNLTLGGFLTGATVGCTSFTHDVKNATAGL